MKRVTIQVCTKDRHSELGLLIQSLRTQSFKHWDLVILDESSTSISNCNFLMALVNRIRLEKHYIQIQNNASQGVCYARNKLIDIDYFNNAYVCRLDDDVILQPDYLTKLLKVIAKGYDIASGVTPFCSVPNIKRNIKYIGKIINEKRFDKKGNLTKYGDDCGIEFLEEVILPADEFRSCALMKKEVVKNIKYENNLSRTGFREEAFFSLRAKWFGYKIGVHTGTIAYHLQCPSGGVRDKNYSENVKSDHNYFMKWSKNMYKKYGDFH